MRCTESFSGLQLPLWSKGLAVRGGFRRFERAKRGGAKRGGKKQEISQVGKLLPVTKDSQNANRGNYWPEEVATSFCNSAEVELNKLRSTATSAMMPVSSAGLASGA